jgi:hypothetical protein
VPTKPLEVRAKPSDDTSAACVSPWLVSSAAPPAAPVRDALSPRDELPIAGS